MPLRGEGDWNFESDFQSLAAISPDADGRHLAETWNIVACLFPHFDPELTHREFRWGYAVGYGERPGAGCHLE